MVMSQQLKIEQILFQCQRDLYFFFLMIRRPPRSTQGVSSAASDVYKRQVHGGEARPKKINKKKHKGEGKKKIKRKDGKRDMDRGRKGKKKQVKRQDKNGRANI
eukprot:TRINITY_DN24541_c0_g2_i1.p1 TRINITY_DN24541_c0_g2~~TRINITY_DN24541_c0_g2_i1.p1  ORF type:complete len:104 (-),score=29.71 TRINITY_DN24541_c0_g2_i1:123-434(-)